MDEYEPSTYGDHWAELYDEWVAVRLPGEAAHTVDFLAFMAGPGPALELPIGTGRRVALPLAARGLEVHGIDASEAMVAKLRAKPGGAEIPVTIGDFADVDVDGRFSLIYVVFNTFFALLTREDQVRCIRNVAEHLTDGGAFVLEAFVPDLTRFDGSQRVEATLVGVDEVRIEASRHDPVDQRVDATHIVLRDGDVRLYPVRLRYAWPSELDLMARLAGLRLRERSSGWKGEPFGADSPRHVSVYERA